MRAVHRIHTPYNDDYPSQLMDPAPSTNPDDRPDRTLKTTRNEKQNDKPGNPTIRVGPTHTGH